MAIPPCDFPYHGSRKAQLGVPADEALPYLRTKVRVETTLLRDAIPLDIRLKRRRLGYRPNHRPGHPEACGGAG